MAAEVLLVLLPHVLREHVLVGTVRRYASRCSSSGASVIARRSSGVAMRPARAVLLSSAPAGHHGELVLPGQLAPSWVAATAHRVLLARLP